MVFLKVQGLEKLVTKNDWPSFTLEEPETYEYKELQAFFAACTKDERVIFKFFLYTGMRDKQVAYTTWRSVNFAQGTTSVRPNPKYEWTTKTYKGREIPVPHSLMDALKAAKHPPMLAMIFCSLLTVGIRNSSLLDAKTLPSVQV
jgi:integrase